MSKFKRWRSAVNYRLVAWTGVFGLGLVPCPDCGLPLAVKIWPVAGVVWLFRRWRRRSAARLDLLLAGDRFPQHHDRPQSPGSAD